MQSMGENVTTLTALTEEITRLEGRVDDLNDIGLKELFIKHRDGNTMDFVVGAEIYKHLEKSRRPLRRRRERDQQHRDRTSLVWWFASPHRF